MVRPPEVAVAHKEQPAVLANRVRAQSPSVRDAAADLAADAAALARLAEEADLAGGAQAVPGDLADPAEEPVPRTLSTRSRPMACCERSIFQTVTTRSRRCGSCRPMRMPAG